MVTILLVANYKPAYNWDILPYMALALSHEVQDKDSLHARVYRIVKDGQEKGIVPNGTFGELTTKRIPYRVQCYNDADKFNAQLFYYRAKPLYNSLVYSLYAAGIPILTATIIPSVIAGFFILIILYSWMSLYTHRLLAAIVALLMGLLPAFSGLQNTSSPDALSAMFVLLSMYLYFSGKPRLWLWFALTFAVLARIDNFILAAIMLYLVLQPRRGKLLIALALLTVAAAIAILVIPWVSGNNPFWFTRFKFLESHVQYYFHVRNVFRAFFADAYYWIWVALWIALLVVRHKPVRQLVFVITASVIIRLVLFPSLQERFFVPYELALIVAALMAANRRNITAN